MLLKLLRCLLAIVMLLRLRLRGVTSSRGRSTSITDLMKLRDVVRIVLLILVVLRLG